MTRTKAQIKNEINTLECELREVENAARDAEKREWDAIETHWVWNVKWSDDGMNCIIECQRSADTLAAISCHEDKFGRTRMANPSEILSFRHLLVNNLLFAYGGGSCITTASKGRGIEMVPVVLSDRDRDALLSGYVTENIRAPFSR